MTGPAGDAATPRGRRWHRVAAAVLVAVAGLVVALTPWWGHDLAYFRVTEVDVLGARYARPAEVLARLRLDTTSSVWTRLDTLKARVRAHPQVLDVDIARRLPGRIVVRITERDPVAVVAGSDGMRAYDHAGRRLPVDPARPAPDVPVVSQADTLVFALLADLKERFPALHARVSEVRLAAGGQLRIVLFNVVVLTMRDVSADRFLELSSVEADLARRHVTPAEIDLRFKDQVIARLP